MVVNIVAASVLAIIVIVSLQTILSPYLNYKNFFELVNGVPVSHISDMEYQAANWLRNHIDISKSPNSYIVSDHATSHIIRGMTGLNTTASRHPDIAIQDWQTMQHEIKSVFLQSSKAEIYDVIDSIKNDTRVSEVYIVLSKRTCWWAAQQNVETIRFMPLPSDYHWEYYCSRVEKNLQEVFGLDVIFQNTDVSIYIYDKPIISVESRIGP